MIDWAQVIYVIVGIAVAIGGYLYKELKNKLDRLHEDVLIYKTFVAERYVSNDQLTKAVESLNRSVSSVTEGILRIETRLNNQIDNSNSRTHNGNNNN